MRRTTDALTVSSSLARTYAETARESTKKQGQPIGLPRAGRRLKLSKIRRLWGWVKPLSGDFWAPYAGCRTARRLPLHPFEPPSRRIAAGGDTRPNTPRWRPEDNGR